MMYVNWDFALGKDGVDFPPFLDIKAVFYVKFIFRTMLKIVVKFDVENRI